MTNAREFLYEIAAQLRAKGRAVEVTESTNEFGTFVFLSSLPPSWYERAISLSAYKATRTNRWSLGALSIDHGKIERKTRTAIRIAADVYA